MITNSLYVILIKSLKRIPTVLIGSQWFLDSFVKPSLDTGHPPTKYTAMSCVTPVVFWVVYEVNTLFSFEQSELTYN